MNERINYLAVGSFILLGAIALIAVGIWVGGAGQVVPMSRYTVVFERDVNGLTEGSVVRYLGVDVGQVDDIGLTDTGDIAVEVQINIARATPVDGGTYASLAYQGITGVAFINLASEPGEHGPLMTAGDRAYPVLPARDVGIAALLRSGPQVVDRLDTLLEDAGAVLDEDNRRSVKRIMENLEQVTGALAAMPARMSETLATMQSTLEQMGNITAEAGPELIATSNNLRQSTDNLVNVTGQLDRWLVENDAAIDSFMTGGLGETAALVADTRRAMRELQKLGTQLRGNPSQILYQTRLEPVVVAQ